VRLGSEVTGRVAGDRLGVTGLDEIARVVATVQGGAPGSASPTRRT
jgi:hypothetical protein